jgi:hypothetical protein
MKAKGLEVAQRLLVLEGRLNLKTKAAKAAALPIITMALSV